MRKWYPTLVVAVALAFTAAVYGRLPERLPVHWGIDGEVDRYGSRVEGALLMPAIMLLLWALMKALPKIDPHRENYAKFADTYQLLVDATLTALMLMHVTMLGIALGWPLSVARVMPAIVGLLLLAIGNVLPRARPNWWFGIRTPWTLTNERVWMRTHRFGGYLLAASGAAFLLAAAAPSRVTLTVAIGVTLAATFGSFIYSYFTWKQETAK